ncbi:DUF1569 domain-containing protein [Isosphaeraceae bacterium EP7]
MSNRRRTLSFGGLHDVMPEVDRLLAGHRTAGRWSLGQICNHLGAGIVLSVDGFPGSAPWPIRATLGRFYKRKVLRSGVMPAGGKLPEKFTPRPGLDDRAEAEALRAAINAFSAHRGPVAPHPFYGPMTYDEWARLHSIHGAHHLSFTFPGTLPDPAPARLGEKIGSTLS